MSAPAVPNVHKGAASPSLKGRDRTVCRDSRRDIDTRPLPAYSVEKLEIGDEAIFRQCERASVDPSLTWVQAASRVLTEASAAT